MRGLRRVLLALVGVLYVVSIPWYRQAESEPRLWLGLPDWVTVALGCYLLAAILNAVAWLVTDVPDPPPDEEAGP
jgi:hypothetical protein